MTLLGRALSRDATFYTVGMAAVFPFAIATALVSTAYLAPADYGRLGLLMLFAGLVTIVYGLGVIQGTLMWAYGAAGDDGDDDGGDVELGEGEGEVLANREHRRKVLGSGMALATIIAALGTALLLAAASPLSELITGSAALQNGVRWAAVSAGLGSVWRLGLQVYRMERRPAMFLVVSISRPLFALVLTALLLSHGYGLEGAVAAVAIATALSLILAVAAALSSYAFHVSSSAFGEIYRRGGSFVPMILVLWFVGNADLWVLSRFAPASDVGLYRLASRFGVFPSYVTSAYLMAWMPMQQSSLFKSAARARTRATLSSTMFTYFCVGSGGLLLLLTVCSELFIGLAPASYREAAPYVPAVAASIIAQGSLYALYRVGRFRRRRHFYVLTTTLAGLVLAGLGSALAGPLGGYGVALAGAVGSLMGAAGMVVKIGRGREPLPFQWRRIFTALALAGGLVAIVIASSATGVQRVGIDVLSLVAYPLVLVASGVIPRAGLRDVLAVVRAAVPRRPGARHLAHRVDALQERRREAILRWVGREPQRAPSLDVDPRDHSSLAALTAGLRDLIGEGVPTAWDAQIGAYLTHRGSNVDRDHLAEQLVTAGADGLELHMLDDAYQTLRQTRRRLPPPADPGPH